ncbi:hypothetical protein V490_00061 [Pseudogymnoascus sp. VKM F-3557]|nr:hypothetical protein V490_00061 [Pseudogymnoascus sp. VKM F-3557]
MTNIGDDAEMATFFRMYRQYQSRNGGQQPPSQPAAGTQHSTDRVHRTTPRLSPRRGHYPSIPPQNASEASSDQQTLQLKQHLEHISATVEDVNTKVEQIKVAFDIMAQTTLEAITRLEVIGRSIIAEALDSQPPNGSTLQPQSSNPQLANQYSHQQPISLNPQRTYQERSAAQPPPSFPSSNPTQPSYAPSSQVPAPYADPSYDFPSFEINGSIAQLTWQPASQNCHIMDPNSGLSIRRTKPIDFGSVHDAASSTRPWKLKRLLRIEFKSPKEDYLFFQELQSDRGNLVCHKKAFFRLAVIRESFSPRPLHLLEELSLIQHPNIAEILDIYFYDGRLAIVTEHLDVCLLDLDFSRFPPEEWEIATIIAEIIKAMSYLLSTLPASEISIESVRLSLQGDVKLGMPLIQLSTGANLLVHNMHYQSSENDYTPSYQYNSEFLVEMLEILTSYGTSSGICWSPEAIEFSSIPASDSLSPFKNHVFLTKAVSSSKLVPRIRLATQVLCCQSQRLPETYGSEAQSFLESP